MVWLSWSIRTWVFISPFGEGYLIFACPLRTAWWLHSQVFALIQQVFVLPYDISWERPALGCLLLYIMLRCPTRLKITTAEKFNALNPNILDQKSVNCDCNYLNICHNFMKWVIPCRDTSEIKGALLGAALSSGGTEVSWETEEKSVNSEGEAADRFVTDGSLGCRCWAGFICLENIYIGLIRCSWRNLITGKT